MSPVAKCLKLENFTITGIVRTAIVVRVGKTFSITVAVSSIRQVHTTGAKFTALCKSGSNTT